MSDNLTLADFAMRMRQVAGAGMRVGMPVRVISYDAARSMVQVQIIQPQRNADGEIVPQPIINEVPVMWPRSGGAYMTFPINAGDTGYAHFADADIGAWVTDGQAVTDSDRQHHINDAVFYPGPVGGGIAANPDAVEIAYAGALFRINADGTVTIDAPTVTLTGTLEAAEAIIGGITFTTHTHGGVTSGGANTGTPV